jgi:hypothetical protein
MIFKVTKKLFTQVYNSPNASTLTIMSIAHYGGGAVGINTTKLVLLKCVIVVESIQTTKMFGGYSCCINQMSIKIHQAPHS